MDKKRKRCIGITWICILVLLVLNVGIGFHPEENQGCLTVVFDKFPMLLANRLVLRIGINSYEISDVDLVRTVVKETMIATSAGLRHMSQDRWIEVYCGNLLVRKIQWVTGADDHMFVVYNEDVFHWILPFSKGEGIVYPSDELIEKLETIR